MEEYKGGVGATSDCNRNSQRLAYFLPRNYSYCIMADVDVDSKIDPTNSKQDIDIDNHVSHMSPSRRAQVEKSLKRKLDLRCSLFVLIYIMNYLDRNNIAAARLGTLQEDLGIDNTQYATCLSIRMFSRF
jgi:hypothetical protein